MNKNVSDLVNEDFKLAVEGTTVAASGEVKNIQTEWKEFDGRSGYNTGHFVPIQLPAYLKKQKVKLSGAAKDKTITVDDDLLLIVRLENLTKTPKKLTVKTTGDEPIMTLDFTGATLAE